MISFKLNQYRYLAIAFALLLSFIHCSVAQVDRYTVAVLPFTVSDPTGRTPKALGETLPNYFEAPIFNSQKFILIDRSITDKIVADIAESDEGLTSETIKALGKTYSVDIFISGSITVEGQSQQPYLINARFIDTSIGEVRSVTQLRVSSDADFQTAAQYITNEGLTRFPLEGQIYAISGADIYIDIGSLQGLSSQDRTGYIYRQVQIKDRIIREQIGSFTIRTMYDDSSKISVDMVIGYQPIEGDSVVIAPVPVSETSSTSTSTSNTTSNTPTSDTTTNDATTGETPATNTVTNDSATNDSATNNSATNDSPVNNSGTSETAATTGTLTVDSNVPAEVFLNSTSLGQTPLTQELTAGNYTLELRAETYETLEQAITIAASETLRLSETLEPVPATVMLSLTPPGTVVRIDGQLQLDRTFTLDAGTYTLELRHNGYETKTLPLSLVSGETINLTEALTATTDSTDSAATQASTMPTTERTPEPVTSETTETTAETETTQAATTGTPETETTAQSTEAQTTTTETAITQTDEAEAGNSALATLNLTVFPPNATVTIDGLPSEVGVLELAPGTRTLKVTSQGYEPFMTQLELSPGQTLPFDVTLGANSTQTTDTAESTTDSTSTTASTAEAASVSETSPNDFATLSERSCNDAATLKSGNFTTETEILFMNQSENPIKTYWVNYGGGLEFYNTLLPGQEVLQQTALTHVWIVTDVNNQCLAIFEPVAEPARAVLR